MKKYTLEDSPWNAIDKTVDLAELQERSPLLKHIDEMQAELTNHHRSMRRPSHTAFADVDFVHLEDIAKQFDQPPQIHKAFERVAKQIMEKAAEVETAKFLRMLTKPWLPNYTNQTMLVMQDNQKAQEFFERYMQPKFKQTPIAEVIQMHLNKESNND